LLRRAIRQADALGLPTGLEIGLGRSRSDLELLFLGLCRRSGLPEPENNVLIGRHEVDFLWRHAMLVIEVDGYRYHRGAGAFEDDRARDLELRRQGFEVLRIGERQLVKRPQQVGVALTAALASAARRVGSDGHQ
jgi:hypothetical protein